MVHRSVNFTYLISKLFLRRKCKITSSNQD